MLAFVLSSILTVSESTHDILHPERADMGSYSSHMTQLATPLLRLFRPNSH